MIYEQQQEANWGDAVVKTLSSDLQKSFPGIKGFSFRNLYTMRDLYFSYKDDKRLQAMTAQISWTHNVVILEKCKDHLEREFYMRMSKMNGWTYRVLMNEIDNKNYEKTLISQNNFCVTIPEHMRPEAMLAVKDEHTFDFLELGEKYSERQLEHALVSNIEDFLREIGNIYTFMGSQYKLEVDGQEFFIDILLYNRRLKAMVALEIKIGSFIPEYVGKMQFYLSVLNDTVRLPDENPSIGIILCKEKSRTIVEYTLKDAAKPIGVSAYTTTEKLPKELMGELPTQEQISKLLSYIK